MKKAMLLLLVLCVAALSAFPAVSEAPSATATLPPQVDETPAASDAPASTATIPSQVDETPAASDASAAQALRVEPMASDIDLSNLTDCTLQVSFDLNQDLVSKNGSYKLTMVACDYDRYDAVEVSQLKEGDTIVIDGQDVVITSIDRTNGVQINGGIDEGGIDEGGYELGSVDGGVLRVWNLDDAIDYHPVGSVTLPLSADFKLIDSSDLEKGETTVSLADFVALQGDAAVFARSNTQARITNGELFYVQRFYMP